MEPQLISLEAGKQADQLFRDAHIDHLAGRAQKAESGYRSALAINPRHAESLHFLGVLALQFGHAQIAAQLIEQSVEIGPTFASLNNLGEAQRQLGRIDQAIELFQRALQMKSDHIDAMANLGVALAQRGNLDQAESWLRRALSINPSHVGALAGLAMLLDRRSQSLPPEKQSAANDDAIAAWDRLVRVAPKHFAYRRSTGDALVRADDFYRAASAYRRAIELNPTDAETRAKLAHCLSMANKFDEALAEAQKAVDLSPNRWEGYRERGRVLERAERTPEALAAYRDALARHPTHPTLHADIGRMLTELGDEAAALEYFQKGQNLEPTNFRFSLSQSKLFYQLERYPESLAAAREAVRLAPHDADAHSGLAFALLVLGQFEEGFTEYEWRWRAATFTTAPRNFEQPLWDGSDITGRNLLLHSEQGFGDTIQFLRYVPLLLRLGIQVTIETPYKLAGLVRRMSPSLRVVIQGTILPDFDLHLPMLSLPAIFHTGTRAVPAEVPYLRADPALAKKWGERLDHDLKESADKRSMRVGLVWAGNPKPDPRRSAKLSDFAPLAHLANVSLIAMQPDVHAEEAKNPPEQMKLLNIGPELRDFSDTTASVLANLDLLITIDTSAAHLAGAMGVPTWLLLRRPPDWRWVGEPRTTPWYPTMRLFRQQKSGDWSSVIQEVASELKQMLAGRT